MDEIQDAAIAFVNQLKAEDRVQVISFDDDIRVLCEPTNNRQDLMKAIRRTRTGGGTRLYDAVDLVLKQKLPKISGRKAVVLFTDGVDTTSRHASYDSTIRAAEVSDGSVYSVAYDTSRDVAAQGGRSPGGRGGVILNIPFPGSGGGRGGSGGGGSSPGDYRRASQYLHEIALQSGGQYFRGDTIMGLSNAFAQVADELRRQYSIGYYPTPVGQPGQRRQINVRVNRADLVVKARDSYIYAQPASNNQDNNVPPTPPGPPVKHLAGSP
jgi:VWFA-related protein